MKKIQIRLKGPSYDFELGLYSHYTLIEGIDSGEGKSWCYDTLRADFSDGLLSIECAYPVVFADELSLTEVLDRKELAVIFVDEIVANKNSFRHLIDETKHLILAITRDSYFVSVAPLHGIYQVFSEEDRFVVRPFNFDQKLPMCASIDSADIIVTEASAEKSENALLSEVLKRCGVSLEIVSAGGKDKIASKLLHLTRTRPDANIVVFMDLGNVSSQLRLLVKRCAQNKNISFYEWDAFEELLCQSNFVMNNSVRQVDYSPFSFLSLERYYERVLQELTKGMPFAYKHKTPIVNHCYFEECFECNECDIECDNKLKAVFDSKVGRVLLEYLSKIGRLTTEVGSDNDKSLKNLDFF